MVRKITYESVNCGDVVPQIKQYVDQETIWQSFGRIARLQPGAQ